MLLVRISKDPEERRNEIIDVSERLFNENGYDNTSISDIVKTIGIAQGTFYYYFKTKEDVLDAIATKYVFNLLSILKEIDGKEDMDALEKINTLFRRILHFNRQRKEVISFMHEERNLLLHHKMELGSLPYLVPYLQSILEEGTEEGIFKIRYPEETAIAIISLIGSLFDQDTLDALVEKKKSRKYYAFFYLLERILGIRNKLDPDMILMEE